MIVTIQPSAISGTLHAPASKSVMQRACAAALVHRGKTIISNPGRSNDDKAALKVLQDLGCTCSMVNNQLTIDSNNAFIHSGEITKPFTIDCGESGLGIRMFTPIAALRSTEVMITGHGSLTGRPMHFFDEVLPALNVDVQSENGLLPLKVRGPLQPANIEIDGSISSQFLTGLLMAYAAAKANDVTVTVKHLKSKPYIDLTLEVMNYFGLKTPVNTNYETFYFDKESYSEKNQTIHYTVEGDWSGAAFLLVAAAIAGEITVNGISITSKQADVKIIEALKNAGAIVNIAADRVQVTKNKLQPFDLDATDCPDLFPPLVALAANCNGVSKIQGLQRLKHKESDRGITLKEEFSKLATRIELNEDEMLIYGNHQLQVKDNILDSHHDHRVAMACAVAALNASSAITIKNADAVKKSYPDFWDHLKQLNAAISLRPFTTDNTFQL